MAAGTKTPAWAGAGCQATSGRPRGWIGRDGGGYVGWAALPPEVGFTAGIGVSLGGLALVPSSYCFVSERSILEPRLGTFIVAPDRNVEIIRGAANINGVAVVNNRVFNQGMSVQRVEQVTGRAVPRVRVGSQAAFYRPAAVANAARQTRSESFVNRPAPRAASAGGRSVPTATHSANGHNSGGTVARSHAAATNPPQHRTQHVAAATLPQHRAQHAAPGSNPPPRHVAGANQPQHATQRSSARPSPPPRHVAAAPQHAGHAPVQANPPRRQPPPPSSRQPQVQKPQPLP